MKIVRTIILLLYSSLAMGQSKGLELKLEILKDTLELLQPFEYCMYFSNNSKDSIETNAFPWEDYKKPWIEIKAKFSSKWKKLYNSEFELGMGPIVQSIYGPLNCWWNPWHSRKIPPKAHYCRQDTYYPLWTNESQIVWQPGKKYKVRIAFWASKDIGIIHSKPVVVYINDSAVNNAFLNGLLKKGLNTEQIFQTYCGLPDSTKAKLEALKMEFPNAYLSNWIALQNVECKFTKLDTNQQMDFTQRMELAKSLLHEQRALAEKLLMDNFDPKNIILGLYANNIYNCFFDLDFQDNENQWIEKMSKTLESCHCN